MQFDVRGAAAVMNVPESTIRRWVIEKHLPAVCIEGQYRFGRVELLEWATAHEVEVSLDVFDSQLPDSEYLALADALEAGGIFYEIPGADTHAVLRSVVDCIALPKGIDADTLLQLFLARERVGTTAIGHGVAVPHAHHPVVLPISKPLLSLCFLAEPVDFGASGGELVHTLFVLLSPTVPMHLQMLARVACLLRSERFRQVLLDRGPHGQILLEARRAEQQFEQDSQGRNSEH